MHVAEAVGRALVEAGVDHVFGVVGSGNFHVTNAMVAAGARFVATRHEGGAATMADAYARTSDTVAAVTLHQGCGLTNAMTGLTEAAKSRTPLVVVAAEVSNPRSNFFVDQDALARAVGAVPVRVTSAATAVSEAVGAVRMAWEQRRTVLLNLPLEVQGLEVDASSSLGLRDRQDDRAPAGRAGRRAGADLSPVVDEDVERLVALLEAAERPVFVAGRGARGAGPDVARLADAYGALLATSAVARGLFVDHPWSLDVSGGFSTPLAAELIAGADLIVGWGCALNMWTMRHGRLIGGGATVVQVDDDSEAIGVHRPGADGVVGDVGAVARAALAQVTGERAGYRSSEVGERLAADGRWSQVAYEDDSEHDTDGTPLRIDARTLTLALDRLLPTERVVAVDSGNFMGYPSAYLSVPDERGFCFTQAFQSIGLGLATAIGAALAQPSRLPVAALGDGGALMGAAELETVVRLGLPMVVVVYDDEAYGAEVHHFGPDDHALDTVTFPPTDVAAVARGYGFEAATVRGVDDLDVLTTWLAGGRTRPLLLDAKITSAASWWLEEAFRGH